MKFNSIILLFLLFFTQTIHAQNRASDTTLAKEFIVKANEYDKSRLFDSAAVFYHNAALIYSKHNLWEKYLESERKSSISVYKNQNYNEAFRIIKNAIDTTILYLDNNNIYLADAYNVLGVLYRFKSNYDKAFYYYYLCLNIRLNILGEKHLDVAASYCNLGMGFGDKTQYNKSLDYYMQALHIYNELLPEKHILKAGIYTMIGNHYSAMEEYSRALKYHFKCLDINQSIYGNEHIKITISFNNIGVNYVEMEQYNEALDYYLKSLAIYKKYLLEDHVEGARIYEKLSILYMKIENTDLALEYQLKSLNINKKIFGQNSKPTILSYKYMGEIYAAKYEYNLAADYFKKSIYANLNIPYDSSCMYCQPVIGECVDQKNLINALRSLAYLYADNAAFIPSRKNIQHVLWLSQVSDTVFNQMRKLMINQSDKIELGNENTMFYARTMEVCLQLDSLNLAFEFSEKNKTMVLQSALAHTNALQLAGIPDSLLQQENNLQKEVALFTQQLAEKPDSTHEVILRDDLFTANRSYEKLIEHFETDYKTYYAIKYDNKMVKVSEIQNNLNDKTCMLSYFTADSVIYISSISKNSFKIVKVDKPGNFENQVTLFQKAILTQNDIIYTNYGEKLYKTLFPENIIAQDIENLVLIPDGTLTTIPFEALLSVNNNDKSYLINDYSVSYAYSANLWYQNQNKQKRTFTNDFLALAPVFSDGSTAGTTLRTRSMFAEMDSLAYATDSIATRGRMLNSEQITALPATETEVTDIFNLYKKRHKKAIVKTHAQANEVFAKSDTLSNSKIIHIATHGFVNEEKPELSGLLLAQDSTLSDDGILYSGEISNLNLNADLVVLSACETGLGQIKTGEGVMGLTRALLFAGADNIMVSLWKVSDESTGQLMVDFYTKMLKDKKNKKSYSQLLRKAKLEMINGGTYSHPYYWSPFVLIGE
ncbi:MAG: CHAT domain-containing protein [Salinivirgaceae bacterium]|nr:CHAT domain-containing protein [Salinivirgaceae bacterium]